MDNPSDNNETAEDMSTTPGETTAEEHQDNSDDLGYTFMSMFPANTSTTVPTTVADDDVDTEMKPIDIGFPDMAPSQNVTVHEQPSEETMALEMPKTTEQTVEPTESNEDINNESKRLENLERDLLEEIEKKRTMQRLIDMLRNGGKK